MEEFPSLMTPAGLIMFIPKTTQMESLEMESWVLPLTIKETNGLQHLVGCPNLMAQPRQHLKRKQSG